MLPEGSPPLGQLVRSSKEDGKLRFVLETQVEDIAGLVVD